MAWFNWFIFGQVCVEHHVSSVEVKKSVKDYYKVLVVVGTTS